MSQHTTCGKSEDNGQHEVWLVFQFERQYDDSLPANYRTVLNEYLSDPIALYQRWPLSFVPRIGEMVYAHDFGIPCWSVCEIGHSLPSVNVPTSSTVIYVKSESGAHNITLTDIFKLCEMRVKVDAGEHSLSLADILRTEGLATSWNEYREMLSRTA